MNILKIEGLTKKYGDFTAIDQLDLAVQKGKIFGLLGPNGAGKSTTIECVLKTKKSKGRIVLLNQDMKSNTKGIFNKIGVQFQKNFYPDRIKVYEICELITALYEEVNSYQDLLKSFGLIDKIKSDVSSLSGGERQKLSVLLALINKPEIVFLDELTTGLDPEARREVWKLLKTLNQQGLTIFLTSHYMEEVMHLCDEIAILVKGKKVIEGTPDDILKLVGETDLESAYLKIIEEVKDESILKII